MALPTALSGAVVFFAIREIWCFLRSLGWRRPIVGLAGGVLIAGLGVMLMMPSALTPAGGYRSALERVVFGARAACAQVASNAF